MKDSVWKKQFRLFFLVEREGNTEEPSNPFLSHMMIIFSIHLKHWCYVNNMWGYIDLKNLLMYLPQYMGLNHLLLTTRGSLKPLL